MKNLSYVIFGFVALLLLLWAPALELIRRTVTPWRERQRREEETGVQRELIVQVGPLKITDRPVSQTQPPKGTE